MRLSLNKALSFFCLLLLLIGCSNSSDSNEIEDAIGTEAPGFTYSSLKGQQISLSDFQGKVVYLFFYGAGCPHCKSNGPITETQIYGKFKSDSNFIALGLDTWNDSASQNFSFKNYTGISYPLLLNARESLIDYYGNSSSYDRSVVIDANGRIAYQGSVFVNSDVDNVIEVIESELEETSL